MAQLVKSIADVAALQLCTGCGVCAFLEPERFRMIDTLDHGRRPQLLSSALAETGEAFGACPGIGLDAAVQPSEDGQITAMSDAWGPVITVYEGHAADEEIRFLGSSGGAATALALFGIQSGRASGVIQSTARADFPILNETVFNRTRDELIGATGSRYAPSSPCDGLDAALNAPKGAVFVGKPCDVAAVVAAGKTRPDLEKKIKVTIAFFCAGVPSTRGTLERCDTVAEASAGEVQSIRYRGRGWPGRWTVKFAGARTRQLFYEESWGFLQRYRQWRCYICSDHSGEYADISVGDPWYRKAEDGEAGKSLIVVRIKRGAEYLKTAMAAGNIVLETEDPDLLPRSQPNLLKARGALWGRLAALAVLGAPRPRFTGFTMFQFWLQLSFKEKRSSLLGTVKRTIVKRLRERLEIAVWNPRERRSRR